MKPKPQEKNKRATNHPTQHHWHEMNRKQRRETCGRSRAKTSPWKCSIPMPQGLISATNLTTWRYRRAEIPNRSGAAERTTAELKAMADWLKQCGIRTVAMQSTGVYWVAAYDIFEQAGLEVYLVNARDTKNLPGRKSDVLESQWLMKLHTYGLLPKFLLRPSQEIRTMRTYWRQRNDRQSAGRHILRMQKALTQMNVRWRTC